MTMTEKDVFKFYAREFKLMYSETEGRTNQIPVELLFEIHAAFDHLSRFHVSNEDEALCAEKAYGHLKRGLLDAYKLKLYNFNEDVEFLKKAESKTVKYDAYDLISDHTNIISDARDARIRESSSDKNAAFDAWKNVSNKIDDFYAKYFGVEKKQDLKQLIKEI